SSAICCRPAAPGCATTWLPSWLPLCVPRPVAATDAAAVGSAAPLIAPCLQVKQLDSLSASLLLQRYFDRPGRAVRVVVRGSEQAEPNGGGAD
ncbi:hypothetical protein HaLaN_31687, partial [Haematococcus lacustris]